MKLLSHETLDKLFIKQKTLKSPSLNYLTLNHHSNNQHSSHNEHTSYESHHVNILKKLSAKSNGTPFHHSKQNILQFKQPSINIHKSEDDQQLHNKNILSQPQVQHPRKSLRHSQQYLIQVLNTNKNNVNITSSQSSSNLNTNNNISTMESVQHMYRGTKKKLNSPHIRQHLKLQQPSIKEAVHYTPNIQNYHSRLRACVSSYCLSPSAGTAHAIGMKCKSVSYKVESKLNEVQFLGPGIPLRKFVSNWEPIETFEVENVFTFTNYGSGENADVGDAKMKSIINNIIITSSGNNHNKGEAETERKGKHLQSRSFNSNNEVVHSRNNMQTYGSVNEEQQKQKIKKKKVHHKKKKKFLCCI